MLRHIGPRVRALRLGKNSCAGGYSVQALAVRRSQTGALVAPAGTRGAGQYRSDLVAAGFDPRLSHDRQLPQGQRGRAVGGQWRVCGAGPQPGPTGRGAGGARRRVLSRRCQHSQHPDQEAAGGADGGAGPRHRRIPCRTDGQRPGGGGGRGRETPPSGGDIAETLTGLGQRRATAAADLAKLVDAARLAYCRPRPGRITAPAAPMPCFGECPTIQTSSTPVCTTLGYTTSRRPYLPSLTARTRGPV